MSNIIQTDASKTGSGAVCQGTTTWESLFMLEKDKTYECTGARCSETYNINLYHRIIGKNNPLTYRHMRPLPCLVKTGEPAVKEIWDYLIANQMAVTPEYLPSSLIIDADWQSRNYKDSSDWKLNPKLFSQIAELRSIPQIELFASCMNHQLPKRMSWYLDPSS